MTKRYLAMLAIAAAMGQAACNENNPPAPSSGSASLTQPQEKPLAEQASAPATATPATPASADPTPGGPTRGTPTAAASDASAQGGSASAVQASASVAELPSIPSGAQWTIFCLSINTPSHIYDANRLKEALIRKTHSHDWYVIHQGDASLLYYGFYATFSDASQPKERDRAIRDRAYISAMVDNNGDKPFERCVFTPLNSPDPAAPAEWDLRNAPGYWGLQIGAYTDSASRKQAAVDAVRQARAQGVQAYFYHGPVISSVVIGTWPRQAVKQQDASSAESADPDRHLLVLDAPLPKGTRTDNVYTSDGQKVKVMVQKAEAQDPAMIAAMNEYPYNAINGEVMLRKIKTKEGYVERPDRSFLVIVPHKDDDPLTDTGTDPSVVDSPPVGSSSPAAADSTATAGSAATAGTAADPSVAGGTPSPAASDGAAPADMPSPAAPAPASSGAPGVDPLGNVGG